MNEKLERLKELAERATQGEWVAFCRSAASEEADIVVSDDAHDRIARTCPSSTDGVEYNNGQYIAAANPETIKGLIAELEAKEAEVEALIELVCNFSLTGLDEVNRETYFALRDGKTGDA